MFPQINGQRVVCTANKKNFEVLIRFLWNKTPNACVFYWFYKDSGKKLSREVPDEVNPRMLTSSHAVRYIKWSLEITCFQGGGLSRFWFLLSESELKVKWIWITFTYTEKEPWAQGFKVRRHSRVMCWNSPLSCSFVLVLSRGNVFWCPVYNRVLQSHNTKETFSSTVVEHKALQVW